MACFSQLKIVCKMQPSLFSLDISHTPLVPTPMPVSTTTVGKQSPPSCGLLRRGRALDFSPQSHLCGDVAPALHTRQPDLAGKPETEAFKFN